MFKVYREEHFGDDPKLLHTINTAGDVYSTEELVKLGKTPETPAVKADADLWAKRYRDSVDKGVRVYAAQEVA